nr:MerR family transcriptional regulator [Streptomyces sp. AK02-04a]
MRRPSPTWCPGLPAGSSGRWQAGELGIRPATLRKWERAGLVHPRRDPRTGYRVYDEADMRDAGMAHQLRRGGYLVEQMPR